MSLTGKHIMFVTAHPDDETLSSGTIAKLTKNGNKVTLVIATSGNRGAITPAISPEELAGQRHREMGEAAAVLGIQNLIWLGYDDGGLDSATDLKEKVFRVIREHEPDIVFTFDPWRRYDFHSDHRTIGLATTEAVYLRRCVWYYPEHAEAGLLAQKPIELYLFQPQEPNYRVDVSEFTKVKIEAAIKHVSQSEDADIKRMMKLNRILDGQTQSANELTQESVASYLGLLQDLCFEEFRKVYSTDYLV